MECDFGSFLHDFKALLASNDEFKAMRWEKIVTITHARANETLPDEYD